MKNIPKVNIGIVAVSRDCFPIELSRKRRRKVAEECKKINLSVTEIEVIVENENDVINALSELRNKKVNALVIYLGNFGPEGPLSLLMQKFEGPVMLAAAAEESGNNLFQGRGDAYCGMLNASYNMDLRHLKPYIPAYPVGIPNEIAGMISDFVPIAKVLLGLKRLKIFSFGPRPQDFLACNAPIKPLYDLGVEIMENSELDLFREFKSLKDDKKIDAILKDMDNDLGPKNIHRDILPKLARYELALENWMETHIGASEYAVFANKCWPSFEHEFGFVPCYVNSRFAAKGIPIACETDIYGALSEYMITCATEYPATLLDINNTVPYDMYEEAKGKVGSYKQSDLFMGFHCGNTPGSCMSNCEMKHQFIMHGLMEPDSKPNITRGTLEGIIRPGNTTIFRLHSSAETKLKAYMAEGEILNINPKSFGSIGVFAINEMARFYRHVLIEQNFPHHTGIAFSHIGRTLFEVCKILSIEEIYFNQSESYKYNTENPFE